jgi:gluconate 2-dehydrogenase subunit 3-like protein
MQFDRRGFLINAGGSLGLAWLTANWPAALAASAQARSAALAVDPPKFKFLSQDQAVEVTAVTSRIIPSNDSPGAKEAGTVYFIDNCLATIAADQQPVYRDGLAKFQEDIRNMFPGIDKFSAASVEQQDKFLHEVEVIPDVTGRRQRYSKHSSDFFETIRTHTVAAFLIDPESEYAGNRSGVGWKSIGREPAHSFQPPFGFYDKGYPGWKPEKSKS